MKFAIISAVWKRPDVFPLFAKGLHNLIDSFPQHQFKVCIAGSEGETSRDMVTKEGFDYIEHPNQPLGQKFNAALQLAKDFDPDFVFLTGSDDLISPRTFQIYLDIIGKYRRIASIGTKDFYFYHLPTGKASYWGGYINHRKGNTCGAGTMLSREFVELWNWKIWKDDLERGLDGSVHKKLKMTFLRKIYFSLKKHGVVSVDLKNNDSLTRFKLWPNTQFIPSKIITDEFKYLQRNR